MRQIFSSQRLENVERVAQMLRDIDIEVRVSNARSYKGQRRRPFSYRDQPSPDSQAAVWVVRSADLPSARQVVRVAGLLQTTRDEQGAYVGLPEPAAPKIPGSSMATRLRIVALVMAIAVSALMWARLG